MNSRILKHMGITKWFSRFQMPNAAKSVLVELENQSNSTHSISEQEIPTSTDNTISSTPVTISSKKTADISELIASVEPKKADTTQSKPITPMSQTPKFRYQAVCINNIFCFIPMSLDIQHDISQTQLSFLQNVVFARFGAKPEVKQRFTYQWPLFQHDRAEQGIEVAQSFFKEQIITHQKDNAFDSIWFFGDLLETINLDNEFLKDTHPKLEILTLPTLEQSMHSSESKKSLWHLIK